MALWHYNIYSRFKPIEVRDAAWATPFCGEGWKACLYIKISVVSIYNVNSSISVCAISVQDCKLIVFSNLLLAWAQKYGISALTISVHACQLFIVVCKKLMSFYYTECAHRFVVPLVNFLIAKNTDVPIARIPAAVVVLNLGKLCFVW